MTDRPRSLPMPSKRLIATLAATAALASAGASVASPAFAEVRRGGAVPAGISVPLPPPSAPTTCRGVPADVILDPDEDYVGTDEAEVIVVLGTNGWVRAEGGDD